MKDSISRKIAMKKTLFLIMLLYCSLSALFSQNKITLDNAISDFAIELTSSISNSQFSGNRSIAVVSFETDSQELMEYFFSEMVKKVRKEGGNIYERSKVDLLLKELNFSLTRYVSKERAQELGNFVSADTVIYGSIASLTKNNTGNEFRITLTGTITETGQIVSQENYDLKMDSRLAGLLGISMNESRLWTIGVSVGSSFSRPLVIGTAHGTIAPFRYSFLELGIDVGFFSRKPDESYYTICPFAHYAFFLPFDKGGFYTGVGVGYVFGSLTYQDERDPDAIRIIVADGIIGANIMNYLDISYTLRTTFRSVTNKFSIGYTWRFK